MPCTERRNAACYVRMTQLFVNDSAATDLVKRRIEAVQVKDAVARVAKQRRLIVVDPTLLAPRIRGEVYHHQTCRGGCLRPPWLCHRGLSRRTPCAQCIRCPARRFLVVGGQGSGRGSVARLQGFARVRINKCQHWGPGRSFRAKSGDNLSGTDQKGTKKGHARLPAKQH